MLKDTLCHITRLPQMTPAWLIISQFNLPFVVAHPLHFAPYPHYRFVDSGLQHALILEQSHSHGKVEITAEDVIDFTQKRRLQESHFPLVFEFNELTQFRFPLRHRVARIEVHRAVARQRNRESAHLHCCCCWRVWVADLAASSRNQHRPAWTRVPCRWRSEMRPLSDTRSKFLKACSYACMMPPSWCVTSISSIQLSNFLG